MNRPNELIIYRMPDEVSPTLRLVSYILSLNTVLITRHEHYVLNNDPNDPPIPDSMENLASMLEIALGIRRVIRDVRPRKGLQAVRTSALPHLHVVKS